MNCKKIQNLLITDYLDGELKDMVLCSRIQQHITNCIHCRQFEQEIQTIRAPFTKTGHIEPPARVWDGICKKITAEQRLQPASLFEQKLEWLREFLFLRPPVFAAATVLAIVTLALLFMHVPEQHQVKIDAKDMVVENFGVMVDEENSTIYDFGTDIEEYFL